jgi:hypothetical protein
MKRGLFTVLGIGAGVVATLLPQRADPQEVTIELAGEVPASCQLAGLTGAVNLGPITAVGTVRIPFQVRCNIPFSFSVTSGSGALRTAHATPPPAGFTAAVPYHIALQIPTNVGAITGTCTSTALKAGAASCFYPSSGQGIALAGDASLTLSWQVSGIPLSGGFTDILTLSVGPLY